MDTLDDVDADDDVDAELDVDALVKNFFNCYERILSLSSCNIIVWTHFLVIAKYKRVVVLFRKCGNCFF